MIKNIQHQAFSITAGSATNKILTIDTLDPSRAMVFFYGHGIREEGNEDVGIAMVQVHPYLVAIASTLCTINMAGYVSYVGAGSISIVEYI